MGAFISMADLSGALVPNVDFKVLVSRESRALAEQAKNNPLASAADTQAMAMLVPRATSLLAAVDQQQQWDENQTAYCSLPFTTPCYDNQTTVRQNLFIAIDTARSRLAAITGSAPPVSAPLANQAPIQSVNLTQQTAANYPDAVREVAAERTQQVQQAVTTAVEKDPGLISRALSQAREFFGVAPATAQRPAPPAPTAAPTTPAPSPAPSPPQPQLPSPQPSVTRTPPTPTPSVPAPSAPRPSTVAPSQTSRPLFSGQDITQIARSISEAGASVGTQFIQSNADRTSARYRSQAEQIRAATAAAQQRALVQAPRGGISPILIVAGVAAAGILIYAIVSD
jgi:hypothetical protein